MVVQVVKEVEDLADVHNCTANYFFAVLFMVHVSWSPGVRYLLLLAEKTSDLLLYGDTDFATEESSCIRKSADKDAFLFIFRGYAI